MTEVPRVFPRGDISVNLTNMKNAERRPYRMAARAQSAAATGERILDAAVALFWERPAEGVVLADVAERAGVTVQTVLRRFGSKEALFEACLQRETARVAHERSLPPGPSLEEAVRVLVDHYERDGAGVARLLAEERRSAVVARVAEHGRAVHRAWCEAAFAGPLTDRSGPERDRLLAQLVAVCDLGTWRTLRGCGLDRAETERALVELLRPLLTSRFPAATAPTPTDEEDA
ncbi:MAG: TetR/AcrR family transcriptional regulator [Actinotalea sp.]|nr:TetR/AcrR family transcriptional regulator [Actinotalea sp.]